MTTSDTPKEYKPIGYARKQDLLMYRPVVTMYANKIEPENGHEAVEIFSGDQVAWMREELERALTAEREKNAKLREEIREAVLRNSLLREEVLEEAARGGVLVRLARIEGYEDVAPELIVEDSRIQWEEFEIVWPAP